MISEIRKLTFQVDAGEAGKRLDQLLSSIPEIGSRAVAQKLINGGAVLVEGKNRNKSHTPSAGELVEINLPASLELAMEPEEMELSIPFEDEFLLVVDKPAGLVTHPARGHISHTLVHGLLAHQIKGGEHPHRPGIVHRLDKETSGLLIVAKDPETHRRLSAMLKQHEIERTYMALVHGLFETREGTIEAPLARDPSHRKKIAVAGNHGRDAVTHFKVIKSWRATGGGLAANRLTLAARPGKKSIEGAFSLLEVKLETGRTHQIRVHLEAIGHPVAGDPSYGRRRDTLGVGRQFLHSARLKFVHPMTGKTLDITAPLPEDLQSSLDRLGG